MVRIHLSPAASQVRTRAGVQALILILDNHEFFRQVGVALTTAIPRKRTGPIAAIVGWAVALALTGCSQLVAPGSQAPVIDSHIATSISSPQTDGQVPVSGASLSSRDVVWAGGFPVIAAAQREWDAAHPGEAKTEPELVEHKVEPIKAVVTGGRHVRR
jgi:hypothetical protein